MTLFKTVKCSCGNTCENCLKQENLGLCPKVFFTECNGSIVNIGSNAALVASNAGSNLDALAILEEMALSYELGNRTIFSSVKRLLPWERMESRDGIFSVEADVLDAPPPSNLEVLSDQVCTAFADGVALELTGGLDSRLLLATALRRGIRPKLSFTIGESTSYDVKAASAIAEQFQFPHITIPIVIDKDRIKQDMFDFVRATGYAVNAACYAWIPATLEVLNSQRTAQMTGLVGELAGSFYYTPFDPLIEPLSLERYWVKYRLMRASLAWRELWKPEVLREMEADLIEAALEAVNRYSGVWRERIDLLYKNERIRRWALPVLDASNTYYTVVAPLLSREYCAWAASLPVAVRVNRNPQRELLRQAHSQLANFKLASHASSSKSLASLSSKVVHRLRRKKRPSALGATQSAIALAQDLDIQDYVRAMAHESDIGFSVESIELLLNSPDVHPELFGNLVTAALAWSDLKKFRLQRQVT